MNPPLVPETPNHGLPTSPWQVGRRIRRFVRLPLGEKIYAIRKKIPFLPKPPLMMRLAFGAKWYLKKDHVSGPAQEGRFEVLETSFESRFLQPGMTVLDIGAHHGFHTLLASLRVGKSGRVISFEPSIREREALLKHLKLNRCKNVAVQSLALGAEAKDAQLNVVESVESGCNSLAPPSSEALSLAQMVQVVRLDDWLHGHAIDRVDFVKLDVEGGERDVLRGAEALLSRPPRPVLLVEVQDVRTAPWGYRAKAIIDHLVQRDYTWFRLLDGGFLTRLDVSAEEFDGNFVAWPRERLNEVKGVAPDSDVGARYDAVWVDVGAHLGQGTLEAAIANPRLIVFAFEPNWAVARRVMGRAANFVVLPMAVSDTEGSADFFINSNEESSSLSVMEESGLSYWRDVNLSIAGRVTVQTIRLDTFMRLAGLGAIDYLKVDAEGMDLKVIQSAGKRLKDIKRITLEVDVAPDRLYQGAPTRDEVLAFMRGNGFELDGQETQSSGRQQNLTFRLTDQRALAAVQA